MSGFGDLKIKMNAQAVKAVTKKGVMLRHSKHVRWALRTMHNGQCMTYRPLPTCFECLSMTPPAFNVKNIFNR